MDLVPLWYVGSSRIAWSWDIALVSWRSVLHWRNWILRGVDYSICKFTKFYSQNIFQNEVILLAQIWFTSSQLCPHCHCSIRSVGYLPYKKIVKKRKVELTFELCHLFIFNWTRNNIFFFILLLRVAPLSHINKIRINTYPIRSNWRVNGYFVYSTEVLDWKHIYNISFVYF